MPRVKHGLRVMGRANDDDMSARRSRSIRLAEDEISALLDRMDRADREAQPKPRPPRYSYRIMALQLDVWQIGNSTFVPYSVPTRWLSSNGLSCLFGCFVHPGTACRAKLVTLYGTWLEAEGVVRRCRHVDGNVHDMEMAFVRPVDTAMCCSDAVPCQVLLVEDDQLTARMITAWLTQHNATVRHSEDGHAALQVATDQKFDLVLLDLELPVLDGISTARALRADDFAGRIVAISSLNSAEVQRTALEAGCDQFMAKPFGRADVAELLRALRQEPLLSTLHDDESVAELLKAFIEQLPKEMSAIRRAIESADQRALNALVRKLKSQAAVYGYEMIAIAADAVFAALTEGASAAEVRSRVDYTLNLCSRARSPN